MTFNLPGPSRARPARPGASLVHPVFGALFLVTLGLGITAGVASGQQQEQGWVFSSLPQADLWFHGMALVDPIGPGPNPLYDPTYPSVIRRAKAEVGITSSVLSDRAGYFREAFRRDPAFEVFHFIPLYFPRAGRAEFFSALKLLVGTDQGIPRAPTLHTAFGLAAVGAVLITREQRMVLGEFVAALEAEWDGFFQEWWQERAADTDDLQRSLTDLWGREYGPDLAPFLSEVGMSGGVATLVPSIGVDGRIFGGSPENQTDNVLVVSAPPDMSHGKEAVFSVLREMAFPLVRRVMDETGTGSGSRTEVERLASRAAVRSGALVLELYRPQDLVDYQRFFLSQVGRPSPAGEGLEGAFREAYPLDSTFEAALRLEIFTTKKDGGSV